MGIHPTADVQSQNIGEGTTIWQYVVILPNAKIGRDVNICAHCFIENDVVIKDRVTVKCGVQLWDGLYIEDDAFIGPNVSFTNDKFPRSKQRSQQHFLQTTIQKGASIGAGAIILPGLTIGTGAMVSAGAIVTRSVPPYAVVVGNPARIVRYVDTDLLANNEKNFPFNTPLMHEHQNIMPLGVGDSSLYRMKYVKDMRGDLAVGEFTREIPFIPKRVFFILNVPSKETRGEHAHYTCKQFLVCLAGSCSAVVDDGKRRCEVQLDSPKIGLYLPPMVWGIQYKYSQDAILAIFASEYYDPDDYIRDYAIFLESITKTTSEYLQTDNNLSIHHS